MENFGIGPAKGGSMGARGRPAIRRDRPDFARRSIYCEGGLFYFVRNSILAGFVGQSPIVYFHNQYNGCLICFQLFIKPEGWISYHAGNYGCHGSPRLYARSIKCKGGIFYFEQNYIRRA